MNQCDARSTFSAELLWVQTVRRAAQIDTDQPQLIQQDFPILIMLEMYFGTFSLFVVNTTTTTVRIRVRVRSTVSLLHSNSSSQEEK